MSGLRIADGSILSFKYIVIIVVPPFAIIGVIPAVFFRSRFTDDQIT